MNICREFFNNFPKAPNYEFAEEFANDAIRSGGMYKKLLACPDLRIFLGDEIDDIDIKGNLEALDRTSYQGLSKISSLTKGQCAVMYIAIWRLTKSGMAERNVFIDDHSTASDIVEQILAKQSSYYI